MPKITAFKPKTFSSSTTSPTSRVLTHWAILVAVYFLLIMILPADTRFMHLHRFRLEEFHTLQFLVGLPLMAIWFVSFYGYAKLEEYTRSIHGTPEAAGFRILTRGSAWIAWSLPVYGILGLIRRSLTSAHPGWEGFLTITVNYIDLLFPVIGFTLIGMASRHFMERAKLTLTAANIRGLALLFVVGGVLYCYLIFRQLSTGGLSASHNSFHLPVWLTVLTIVVPYLYAWFVGILAAYELLIYSRRVRGMLYRESFHLMVIGLFAMILGSVALQYTRSTAQVSPTTVLSLGAYFIFSILFQILSGSGFVMIALGTMRLKKIEEV